MKQDGKIHKYRVTIITEGIFTTPHIKDIIQVGRFHPVIGHKGPYRE